jgi:hypothetical protein
LSIYLLRQQKSIKVPGIIKKAIKIHTNKGMIGRMGEKLFLTSGENVDIMEKTCMMVVKITNEMTGELECIEI